jgi:hypothetical protein
MQLFVCSAAPRDGVVEQQSVTPVEVVQRVTSTTSAVLVYGAGALADESVSLESGLLSSLMVKVPEP